MVITLNAVVFNEKLTRSTTVIESTECALVLVAALTLTGSLMTAGTVSAARVKLTGTSSSVPGPHILFHVLWDECCKQGTMGD